ncbi:hypothetical protein FB45DRAFT_897478 [Roridomyces roridus]|uniref:Uncharacterized protein n=1 Tax=Roridomyces roridus TaxID=1738132 RepID=A0AAD7FXA5_9AGAR|nr:hypothetical protein FB45DRAFT_897478 [Roridomyces roridus]
MATPGSDSFYLHSQKSSSPIEIPGRHRDRSARPISPELIFEMDPMEPPTTYYPSGLATTCTQDDPEPLLYSFPRFSAENCNIVAPPKPQSSSSSSRKAPRKCPPTTTASPPAPLDPYVPIKAVPVHKITGFKPDFTAQAPSAIMNPEAPRENQLAPPPRISSASVWTLPGRGDASDDEPRSFELDLDFSQYLIRRMDRRAHFPAFQAVMSVSVR